MLRFIVPGPQVSVNAAYRAGRGRFYMDAPAKAWKERISALARNAMRKAKLKPYAGDVRVEIEFHFAGTRNDLDGPLKLALDALAPFVIPDDLKVTSLGLEKISGSKRPRTEIRVGLQCVCRGTGLIIYVTEDSGDPSYRRIGQRHCMLCEGDPWGWESPFKRTLGGQAGPQTARSTPDASPVAKGG